LAHRKGAKVKAIYNLFSNEQGKVEAEYSIKNFPQKLQEYKDFAEYLKIEGHDSNQVLNLANLRKQYQKNLKEKTILNQTEELLKAKQEFLNIREETIEKLRNCCDILERKTYKGKYAKREKRSKVITIIGKPLNSLTFGLVEAAGEGLSFLNSQSKRKFELKNGKEFQVYLNEEESNLLLLNKFYESLINCLKQNEELEISSVVINALRLEDRLDDEEIKLFQNRYKVYEVAISI
jgi:hypothetical protein